MLTALKKLERMMRIELTPSAWKAEVLPLNYIRIKLERKTRFELATLALARRCSTTEPLPQVTFLVTKVIIAQRKNLGKSK